MKWILKIYDYFSSHLRLLWLSLAVFAVAITCLILHLRYSEDISDFLPLDPTEQEAFSVYQSLSGADRLFILFSNPGDPYRTIAAMDYFEETLLERDSLGWCADLKVRFDDMDVAAVPDFIYDNIPYFLDSEDYVRIDSLLSSAGFIDERMKENRRILMFPTGTFAVTSMKRDPLGLFTPVLSELLSMVPHLSVEMHDGHAFTPDMKMAVAMFSSPFGNSETEYNARMLALVREAVADMSGRYPDINAHIIGGPEIAVGNADRIKKDSIIAISLSVILIILFAAYTIRSLRNIMLLFVSIGCGWLFALGGMAILNDSVSIIVIGISSVILGIAVNYPLHLVVHRALVPDMRTALKEVVNPLIIGNITTIGAFLTLVPLQSTALRDLGLFASLLLAGTIIFVLVYLPHMMKGCQIQPRRRSVILERISGFSPENSRILAGCVLALTVILLLCPKTEFDSNLANINYMTEQQKEDMEYFSRLFAPDSSDTARDIYVFSSGKDIDEALARNELTAPVIDSLTKSGKILSHRGVSSFLSSTEEQRHRLSMWQDFISRHHMLLTEKLNESALQQGFAPGAFSDFTSMIERTQKLEPRDIGYFAPLTQTVLSSYMTSGDIEGKAYVADILRVEPEDADDVRNCFENSFDIIGMNRSVTETLSGNFNYIGWACSLIVFLFLWFSFGRIELAVISFLPMAISWIWILGIMSLLDIKFNIVNIILATFIFGQGDDYTIFMTEGCQHEYSYRRPILGSYKQSILQSALIMFIGIGTLIISKHPALHSLAEVTIIGMFSVVLMSYMIPPLLFKWLTTKNGAVRRYPLTLGLLFRGRRLNPVEQVRGRYIYKHKEILRAVTRSLREFRLPEITSGKSPVYRFRDNGYGEQALLIALTHPELTVLACIPDADRRRIAEISAKDFVHNIKFIKQL